MIRYELAFWIRQKINLSILFWWRFSEIMNFSNQDLLNLAKILEVSRQSQVDPIHKIYNTLKQDSWCRRAADHSNPLCSAGRKIFSQSDEDGISLEILKRLGLEKGEFLEMGVGNGTENNTLVLAALGWSGYWFGNQDLAIAVEGSRVSYVQGWITLENIMRKISGVCSLDTIDVVSVDLDGNDYYFIDLLLASGLCPKLFIAEYNAKFCPPIQFKIDYDPSHQWNGDDYFGASLSTLNDLFKGYGYKLICCNAATGANAFFIKNEFDHLFRDVPEKVEDIYCPINYDLLSAFGHKTSRKTIEALIR